MVTNIWCVRAHLDKNVTEQYRGAIFRALPRNPWDIVLVGMYLGTPGFWFLVFGLQKMALRSWWEYGDEKLKQEEIS